MTTPRKLFIIAQTSTIVRDCLVFWEQGNISWIGCLTKILQFQINSIEQYSKKYPELETTNHLAQTLMPGLDFDTPDLEKESKLLQAIFIAHQVQSQVEEVCISLAESSRIEITDLELIKRIKQTLLQQ